MPSDYRFRPALVLRFMGACLAAVGLGLLVVAGVVVVLDWPLLVLTVAVVGSVLVVVVGGLLLARLAPVVRFDDDGFRVRLLRRAGVTQARWRDVQDAVTATVAGQDCLVLRLKDGRTTTLPVSVLDAGEEQLVGDLRARLDRAHGYRRLR